MPMAVVFYLTSWLVRILLAMLWKPMSYPNTGCEETRAEWQRRITREMNALSEGRSAEDASPFVRLGRAYRRLRIWLDNL